MFYNYFRNVVDLRPCALHYTRDYPCLHSQYLLSRVEGSAHALTFRLRKSNCILCLQPSARTPHGTTHSIYPRSVYQGPRSNRTTDLARHRTARAQQTESMDHDSSAEPNKEQVTQAQLGVVLKLLSIEADPEFSERTYTLDLVPLPQTLTTLRMP